MIFAWAKHKRFVHRDLDSVILDKGNCGQDLKSWGKPSNADRDPGLDFIRDLGANIYRMETNKLPSIGAFEQIPFQFLS